jgi:hypothetical protein
VACLRPPIPPPQTNLMITGWFGDPVPFGGIATYVCARGMQFENDPFQENVTYTCQVETNHQLYFLDVTSLVKFYYLLFLVVCI